MYESVPEVRVKSCAKSENHPQKDSSKSLIDTNIGNEYHVRSVTTYAEPPLEDEHSVPPVKPPRKKKYHQIPRHHSYDCKYK